MPYNKVVGPLDDPNKRIMDSVFFVGSKQLLMGQMPLDKIHNTQLKYPEVKLSDMPQANALQPDLQIETLNFDSKPDTLGSDTHQISPIGIDTPRTQSDPTPIMPSSADSFGLASQTQVQSFPQIKPIVPAGSTGAPSGLFQEPLKEVQSPFVTPASVAPIPITPTPLETQHTFNPYQNHNPQPALTEPTLINPAPITPVYNQPNFEAFTPESSVNDEDVSVNESIESVIPNDFPAAASMPESDEVEQTIQTEDVPMSQAVKALANLEEAEKIVSESSKEVAEILIETRKIIDLMEAKKQIEDRAIDAAVKEGEQALNFENQYEYGQSRAA